uniref:BACK domain-containing protein n=1 Tax=Glossina palpalis gambiensis TaxID=67801 RepID=A0A1B0C2C4_9MUSC
MSQIRLPLVSTEFLTNHIVADPLLTEDQKCNKFLMEALTCQLTEVSQPHEKCQTGTKHRNESFHVFLVGGKRDIENANAMKECKVYNVSKEKHVSISSMNEKRYNHSAASFNGVVYSVGGWNTGALKTAECYDPVSKWWSYIAPMNSTRDSFGICTYNDLIYVVGGWDNSTVESYNPATNKWCFSQSIPAITKSVNRATVAENNIYALTHPLGGNNVFHRFDPRDEKWYNLNEMQSTSSGQYELVSYDRTLFTIGRNECKWLDIRVNKWEPMPHMLSNRTGFSAVIVGKDIYVFGGKKECNSFVTNVERFSVLNNEWTTVDSTEIYLFWGRAAVLSGEFDSN